MTVFGKPRLFLPVLAVAAMLLAASPSQATLEIALQEAGVNGGAITVVGSGADFTGASFTGTYGDFTVTVYGGSSDNAANLSDLLSSTTKVTNNTGTSNVLHLWITQNNYSLPAGSPLSMEAALGGSFNVGSTLNLKNIYQAFADAGNTLFGTSFSTGLQSATANGTSYDTGSANGLFFRSGAYSVTMEVNFQLQGTANYSGHVNLTPTPAPAGLALVLTGLPCLGLGWLRRRQKKQA